MQVHQSKNRYYEVDVTFNEREVQALISLFDQIAMLTQRCEHKGVLGVIYAKLLEIEKRENI